MEEITKEQVESQWYHCCEPECPTTGETHDIFEITSTHPLAFPEGPSTPDYTHACGEHIGQLARPLESAWPWEWTVLLVQEAGKEADHH